MEFFEDDGMPYRSKSAIANRSLGSVDHRKNLKVTVNDNALKRVYALMLQCRMLERRVGADESEAALAGAVAELLPEDAIVSSRPSALVEVVMELGPEDHKPPQRIPADAAASSQLGLAVGVALASKLRREASIVLAITDDRTLAFGVSHEALTFAAVHKLPVIVLLENGGENAAQTPALSTRAHAYGIPTIAVDRNDAVAVYRVAREAMNRARSGRGPSLIECLASDIDPLAHMERYLQKQRLWTPSWKRQLTAEFSRPTRAKR